MIDEENWIVIRDAVCEEVLRAMDGDEHSLDFMLLPALSTAIREMNRQREHAIASHEETLRARDAARVEARWWRVLCGVAMREGLAAVEAEREACAKRCDRARARFLDDAARASHDDPVVTARWQDNDRHKASAAEYLADSIRARGDR